jgi:very-short-patch-repair endonuclease
VISHGTAAALWGLRDRAPGLIDMIVRCETGRKVDGIQARRCRYPANEETIVHEGIPCTTPSRTLVDLAGVLGAGAMRRVVERAGVLELLDIAALDAAVHRAKGRPGMPALRTILLDWRPIGHDLPRLRSDFEARLLSLIAACELPRPRCNQAISSNGRRIEVDFLWDEQRLVVEADGRSFHDNRVAFERDRRRDQDLGLAGYRVVRFTWNQVVREPEATVRILRRLLAGQPTKPARAVP